MCKQLCYQIRRNTTLHGDSVCDEYYFCHIKHCIKIQLYMQAAALVSCQYTGRVLIENHGSNIKYQCSKFVVGLMFTFLDNRFRYGMWVSEIGWLVYWIIWWSLLRQWLSSSSWTMIQGQSLAPETYFDFHRQIQAGWVVPTAKVPTKCRKEIKRKIEYIPARQLRDTKRILCMPLAVYWDVHCIQEYVGGLSSLDEGSAEISQPIKDKYRPGALHPVRSRA